MELDKTLAPICGAINGCYEAMFPGLPMYPKFSLVRAMATLWKANVFPKLESNLMDAFKQLLNAEREEEIRQGQLKTGSERFLSIAIY